MKEVSEYFSDLFHSFVTSAISQKSPSVLTTFFGGLFFHFVANQVICRNKQEKKTANYLDSAKDPRIFASDFDSYIRFGLVC